MINFSQDLLRELGTRIYVQGDLHGSDSWKKLYNKYLQDPHSDKLFIFLGDVIDPEPKDFRIRSESDNPYTPEEDDEYRLQQYVYDNLNEIDRVLKLDKNTYFILGNHEIDRLYPVYGKSPFINSLCPRSVRNYAKYVKNNNKELLDLWNDRVARIKSFIDTNSSKVKIIFTIDNMLFSHLGIKPDVLSKIPHKSSITTKDLMNNSNEYLACFFKDPSVNWRSPDYSPTTQFMKYGGPKYSIIGHYNGLVKDKFPVLLRNPNTTYFMCDDSTNPSGNPRGLIFYKYKDLLDYDVI